MTEKTSKKSVRVAVSSIVWGILALAFLFLVIKNAALSASLAFSSISLCGKTLIPALFPSAVAARVLAQSGALLPMGALFDKISRRIFALSGETFATALTGIICGFPTGAIGAWTLFEKGKIDRGELLRAALLSGTPSMSFLVFAVGERGFGDKSFGFFLFFTAVLSSAAATLVLALLEKRSQKKPLNSPKNKEKPPAFGAYAFGVKELTTAVSSSAVDIIRVCSFVIFFSVAAGLAETALSSLPLPRELFSLCLGCFEITGGMTRAAAIPYGGRIAAAFYSGFGGLSAAAQVGAILSEAKFPMLKYLLARLFAGFLAAALTLFFFCAR